MPAARQGARGAGPGRAAARARRGSVAAVPADLYASALLGVGRPALFIDPSAPDRPRAGDRGRRGAPRSRPGGGGRLARPRAEREVAFLVGRAVAMMRFEHMVLWPRACSRRPPSCKALVLGLCKAFPASTGGVGAWRGRSSSTLVLRAPPAAARARAADDGGAVAGRARGRPSTWRPGPPGPADRQPRRPAGVRRPAAPPSASAHRGGQARGRPPTRPSGDLDPLERLGRAPGPARAAGPGHRAGGP